MDGDVIDGEAQEVHPEQTSLAVAATTDPASANLFRTNNPAEVVQRATQVADALKDVLTSRGLTSKIQGREHVKVEGWTTLGAMVGVTAVTVWTRPLERDDKVHGYEARVEARTLDGRVIGAAEAMCTRAESTWKSRDDYALRSMAQTRATSKALRGPLGFVVTLAGYEATPDEELPRDTPASSAGPVPASDDLARSALNAVGYMLGGDAERAQRTLERAAGRTGGVLSDAAAFALAALGASRRDLTTTADVPWTDEDENAPTDLPPAGEGRP
jgi:hypothetical protein